MVLKLLRRAAAFYGLYNHTDAAAPNSVILIHFDYIHAVSLPLGQLTHLTPFQHWPEGPELGPDQANKYIAKTLRRAPLAGADTFQAARRPAPAGQGNLQCDTAFPVPGHMQYPT